MQAFLFLILTQCGNFQASQFVSDGPPQKLPSFHPGTSYSLNTCEKTFFVHFTVAATLILLLQ